jgi:hypothetical protein
MIDLEEIDLDDLRPTVPDNYEKSYTMWDGDHWQEGAGWESVLPDASENAQKHAKEKKRVAEAFTSQNVVREVVERHLNGVVGRLPAVDYLRAESEDQGDSEEQERAKDVAEAMPGAEETARILRTAGRHALCGAVPLLRVYPNAKAYTEGGDLRSDLSFEMAAEALVHEVVAPSQGHLARIDGERVAAYWREDDNGERTVEVSILDDEGRTVLAIIEEEDTADGPERTISRSSALDLGRRLHMQPVGREALITRQVRQQQHGVNKALTMSDTNLDWGGFVERIFLNAQRPQKKVKKRSGETEWVDAPYTVGAGETTFLAGVVTETAEGDEQVATPGVKIKEPTDVDTFEDTKNMFYETILSEADQRHILMSGDASSSGIARVAARKEYVASLRPTMRALSTAGEWSIQVLPRLTSILSGERRMDGVEASINLRLDRGVLSTKEQRVLMEQVESEQLSLRTMLDRMGLSDVAQELDRIAEENVPTVQRRKVMATITKELSAAGANIRAAARVAGFEDEEAAELQEAVVPQTRQ